MIMSDEQSQQYEDPAMTMGLPTMQTAEGHHA